MLIARIANSFFIIWDIKKIIHLKITKKEIEFQKKIKKNDWKW